MLVGIYFALSPYLQGIEQLRQHPEMLFQSLNAVLIFMGLSVSFSSLQDTSKTQNKISKKIWQDPVKGKIMIIILSFMILFFLTFGLIGFFVYDFGILKNLSVGIIIFSLGMFGLLKAAVEMFENHRLDKNAVPNDL
jgi:magnesium-transporting ATPase (P-type)